MGGSLQTATALHVLVEAQARRTASFISMMEREALGGNGCYGLLTGSLSDDLDARALDKRGARGVAQRDRSSENSREGGCCLRTPRMRAGSCPTALGVVIVFRLVAMGWRRFLRGGWFCVRVSLPGDHYAAPFLAQNTKLTSGRRSHKSEFSSHAFGTHAGWKQTARIFRRQAVCGIWRGLHISILQTAQEKQREGHPFGYELTTLIAEDWPEWLRHTQLVYRRPEPAPWRETNS